MKVVDPSPLLTEAADVLDPVRDEVVVVGAAALEVALDKAVASITPTRDVDVVVGVKEATAVVRQLEDANLSESEADHERGFTWVRGDLKVQLMRGFHPFPPGRSRKLPANPAAESARSDEHRELVAFAEKPTDPRLWVATPACLVSLKQVAFGRIRPTGGEVVKRDYHDVYLLLAHAEDEVLATYADADGGVRGRVRKAIDQLQSDTDAIRLAAEEMVALGEARSQADAEREVVLVARAFSKRL